MGKVKKIYYYDPKKLSPVPGLPPVELPPENLDSSTDPVKEGQSHPNSSSQGNNMSFLPSRAFNIEVENLSFRKHNNLNNPTSSTDSNRNTITKKVCILT